MGWLQRRVVLLLLVTGAPGPAAENFWQVNALCHVSNGICPHMCIRFVQKMCIYSGRCWARDEGVWISPHSHCVDIHVAAAVVEMIGAWVVRHETPM